MAGDATDGRAAMLVPFKLTQFRSVKIRTRPQKFLKRPSQIQRSVNQAPRSLPAVRRLDNSDGFRTFLQHRCVSQRKSPCLSPATSSPAPCGSPDLSKWDKMFSMLENSQMRENMLLQYADDIIKVEIGSLRGEMLRWVNTNSSIHQTGSHSS